MKPEKRKLSKVVSVLSSIIFIPIVFISLVTSVLMLSSKMKNEVPSIFGYSSVCILTPSMVDGGFEPGTFVMVKRVDVSTLKKSTDGQKNGDIIAFYNYHEYKLNQSEQTSFVPSDEPNKNNNFLTFGAFTEGQKEAAKKGSSVYFHRIVDIVYVNNSSGEFDQYDPTCYFFYTQGDSTNSVDTPIRGDMVVGVYCPQLNGLASVFQFCSSITGILILVLVPCGILLIMIGISIINQVGEIKTESEENTSQYVFAGQIYQDKINEKIEIQLEEEKKEKEKDKHEEIKKQIEEESGIKIEEKPIKEKVKKQKPEKKQKEKKSDKNLKEGIVTAQFNLNQSVVNENKEQEEKTEISEKVIKAPEKPVVPSKPEKQDNIAEKVDVEKPVIPNIPAPKKPVEDSGDKKLVAPKVPTEIKEKKPVAPKKPLLENAENSKVQDKTIEHNDLVVPKKPVAPKKPVKVEKESAEKIVVEKPKMPKPPKVEKSEQPKKPEAPKKPTNKEEKKVTIPKKPTTKKVDENEKVSGDEKPIEAKVEIPKKPKSIKTKTE